MSKANSGSHEDKNGDIIDNIMLTYSWIKLTDVPLFILKVVICIGTSSIEVFNEKGSSPAKNVYLKLQ
jgi:hypothetical protein